MTVVQVPIYSEYGSPVPWEEGGVWVPGREGGVGVEIENA